jgi:hypothetical protein
MEQDRRVFVFELGWLSEEATLGKKQFWGRAMLKQ